MANRGRDYTSKTNLKVIQLNVLSWNSISRRLWISLYLQDKSPDVILLNSTSLISTAHNKNCLTTIKFVGYKTYLTKQEAHYGSAILIKNNLNHSIIPNLSERSIAVKVSTSVGPVIFLTSYIPPRIKSINPLDFRKVISANAPLLVAGDFNANHQFFGNCKRAPNHRGELLYNICQMYKLEFLGPDFNTFYSGNKKGKPDIVLGNRLMSIFNKHISQGPRVGSDHIPIQIELDTKPIYIKTDEKLPDYKKANWDDFKQNLRFLIPPILNNQKPAQIDKSITELYDHINNASNSNIPIAKQKKFSKILTLLLQLN